MIAMTPLEQALVAWTRATDEPHIDERALRQMRFDDAVTLGECGVFSNRNISLITGLHQETVGRLTGKTSKTGGRLNPESLPFLQDAAIFWRRHHSPDVDNLRVARGLGTSVRMIATLSGVPASTVHTHTKEAS